MSEVEKLGSKSWQSLLYITCLLFLEYLRLLQKKKKNTEQLEINYFSSIKSQLCATATQKDIEL